jgi:hypothetical protein
VHLGPYPVKYAKEWISTVHRRIPELTGAMWGVGLWVGDEMRGLAVVGRMNARVADVPARTRITTLCVLRVAVVEGTPNGCSALYGACSRAAKAMGAESLCMYIHEDETGTSLKAAGWVRDLKPTTGGEHGREKRPRKAALDAKPKWRWWAPWSKCLADTRVCAAGLSSLP